MIAQLPDIVRELRLDLLATLLGAIILGGAVGLERELHRKPAGLRTNVLICVGAALFTQLSPAIAGAVGDPGRIAAQIVSGVGFIGAGTIIHGRGNITGLTSAATIWLVAAIGMALGAGAILEAVGTTVLVVLVLAGLGRVERFAARRSVVTNLEVEVDDTPEAVRAVEHIINAAGLSVEEKMTTTEGGHVILSFQVRGPRHRQDRSQLELLRSSGAYRVSVVK